METIYNWLLQSMGNEGNAYTILNCRRTQRTEGGEYIQVMARLKDFSLINLLISNRQLAEDETVKLTGGSVDFDRYTLADQTDVIEYLHTGEMTVSTTSTEDNTIQVLVFKPVGETGELTFPPEQTN